jgi:two-component system nitrate/nitrite response regulator NarL
VSDLIRVGVADDHPMFRAGVVSALSDVSDVEMIGEANDAPGAIALAVAELPDVMVLDIAMPGSGLVAATRIRDSCPATRIVMLTVSEDEDDILASVKAGAAAYVLKGAGASELIDVIRAVYAGEVYVAPALAWGMLREMSAPRTAPYDDELTAREKEVLELVAEGMSNQEIGERLGLAEKTIKHHMTNILGKLHVRSRVEAALLVARGGMPPASDR